MPNWRAAADAIIRGDRSGVQEMFGTTNYNDVVEFCKTNRIGSAADFSSYKRRTRMAAIEERNNLMCTLSSFMAHNRVVLEYAVWKLGLSQSVFVQPEIVLDRLPAELNDYVAQARDKMLAEVLQRDGAS